VDTNVALALLADGAMGGYDVLFYARFQLILLAKLSVLLVAILQVNFTSVVTLLYRHSHNVTMKQLELKFFVVVLVFD